MPQPALPPPQAGQCIADVDAANTRLTKATKAARVAQDGIMPPAAAALVAGTAGSSSSSESEMEYIKRKLADTEKLVMDLAKQLQALLGASSTTAPPKAVAPEQPAAVVTPPPAVTQPVAAVPKAPEAIVEPVKAPEPVVAAPTTPVAAAPLPVLKPVVAGGEDDYAGILSLAYLFYEGQMAGDLPAWNRLLAGKPGGYKKSAHLNDGKEIGADLSGGFYDAGGEGLRWWWRPCACWLRVGLARQPAVLSCLHVQRC